MGKLSRNIDLTVDLNLNESVIYNEVILICYVIMILPTEDRCSDNLKFRAYNLRKYTELYLKHCERPGDLMLSMLDSNSSSLGLSPSIGHCVVFLGNTLQSHSASVHPSIQMSASKLNAYGLYIAEL